MKEKLLIIGIVGIFLASGILSALSADTTKVESKILDLNISHDETEALTSYDFNKAYFGEVWSLNKEKSFGSADLNVKKDVYANWQAEGNEASGYLAMKFANFIANRSGEILSNYRLSTYKLTIHDGPSTSDPILFTDEKEILENSGDVVGNLTYPITIDTKGQMNRTLAVVCTSETQLISNFLNTPIQGKSGIKEETGTFHVNFDGSQYDGNNENNFPITQNCFNRSELNVDLGTIELYSTANRSNIPIITTSNVITDYIFQVNRSDKPIEIDVSVNYSIDLKAVPGPNTLSKILGSKADFLLEGAYYHTNRTESVCSESKTISLVEGTLNRTVTLNRSFILKEEPLELVFSVSCELFYSTINFWDFSIPNESFKSELCLVKIVYI